MAERGDLERALGRSGSGWVAGAGAGVKHCPLVRTRPFLRSRVTAYDPRADPRRGRCVLFVKVILFSAYEGRTSGLVLRILKSI